MLCVVVALVAGCQSTTWEPPPATATWTQPTTTAPIEGLRVEVGDSIQETVDAAPENATIVLAAGVHRLQQVVPRPNQTFVGEPGAILNGATVLEGFVQEGDSWVHRGFSAEGEERGSCRRSHPACRLPEDLFLDGELVKRVDRVQDIDETTWFMDHQAQEVILGFDPAGRVVEVSTLPFAFGGDAVNVTIQGLVVEMYAAPAQRGAIETSRHWRILDSEVRLNHGTGVRLATGGSVENSYLHHNGQFGVSGGGSDLTISGNEIAFNGTVGISPGWAAGGTKFVHVIDLELSGNTVHSNWGPGLWVDGGQDGSRYIDNRVFENEHAGIKHEISGSARIEGNVVTGNGFGHDVSLRGAGILIRESGPVEIIGNTVDSNRDAIVLLQDDDRQNDTGNRLHGIIIRDNEVEFADGKLGYLGDLDADFPQTELMVSDNRYVGAEADIRFVIGGRSARLERWRDVTGDNSTLVTEEG